MKQTDRSLTDEQRQVDKNVEVTVIVPAKPLNEAKSRLAALLTVVERKVLAYHLLEHTLQVLVLLQKQNPRIKTLLVSADHDLLEIGHRYGVDTLFEADFAQEDDSTRRLNKALSRAALHAVERDKPEGLLILPSDLPFLEVEDLALFLQLEAALPGHHKFLINPDRAEDGTNALFLKPPSLLGFNFHFGPNSLSTHLKEAQALKIPQIEICHIAGLVFDLDQPADFVSLPAELQLQLLAELETPRPSSTKPQI